MQSQDHQGGGYHHSQSEQAQFRGKEHRQHKLQQRQFSLSDPQDQSASNGSSQATYQGTPTSHGNIDSVGYYNYANASRNSVSIVAQNQVNTPFEAFNNFPQPYYHSSMMRNPTPNTTTPSTSRYNQINIHADAMSPGVQASFNDGVSYEQYMDSLHQFNPKHQQQDQVYHQQQDQVYHQQQHTHVESRYSRNSITKSVNAHTNGSGKTHSEQTHNFPTKFHRPDSDSKDENVIKASKVGQKRNGDEADSTNLENVDDGAQCPRNANSSDVVNNVPMPAYQAMCNIQSQLQQQQQQQQLQQYQQYQQLQQMQSPALYNNLLQMTRQSPIMGIPFANTLIPTYQPNTQIPAQTEQQKLLFQRLQQQQLQMAQQFQKHTEEMPSTRSPISTPVGKTSKIKQRHNPNRETPDKQMSLEEEGIRRNNSVLSTSSVESHANDETRDNSKSNAASANVAAAPNIPQQQQHLQFNQFQQLQMLQMQQLQQLQQLQKLQQLQQLQPVVDPVLSATIMDSLNKLLLNQYNQAQLQQLDQTQFQYPNLVQNYLQSPINKSQAQTPSQFQTQAQRYPQVQPQPQLDHDIVEANLPLENSKDQNTQKSQLTPDRSGQQGGHTQTRFQHPHAHQYHHLQPQSQSLSQSQLQAQPQAQLQPQPHQPYSKHPSFSEALQSRCNSNASFANIISDYNPLGVFNNVPFFGTPGVLPEMTQNIFPHPYNTSIMSTVMIPSTSLNEGTPYTNSNSDIPNESDMIRKPAGGGRHPTAKSKDTSNDPLDPKKYRCGHCTWSFSRASDLRRHFKSHKKPQYHCPFWNEKYNTCPHKSFGSFNRLDVLKRHLKLVHYDPDDEEVFKIKRRKIKNEDGSEEHTKELHNASENIEKDKEKDNENGGRDEDSHENGDENENETNIEGSPVDKSTISDAGSCLSCGKYFKKARDFIAHVSACAEKTPMKKWRFKKNGFMNHVLKQGANPNEELEPRRIPPNRILEGCPPAETTGADIVVDDSAVLEKGNLEAIKEDQYVTVKDVKLGPENMNDALNRRRGRPKKRG